MSYTTEGTIETIFDEETHGNNGFKKRTSSSSRYKR